MCSILGGFEADRISKMDLSKVHRLKTAEKFQSNGHVNGLKLQLFLEMNFLHNE